MEGLSVHPRRCGEHPRQLPAVLFGIGSSPQVRGTRRHIRIADRRRRFIPAGAGNTMVSASMITDHLVHPRRCGEHLRRARYVVEGIGSSPQVRGTRAGGTQPADYGRFIPAGAGNTVSSMFGSSARPVHPRRCGEHASHLVNARPQSGSSPQVRGTPDQGDGDRVAARFIPAGAGNTQSLPGTP